VAGAGGGRSETVVWQVDGATARELARVPRTSVAPDGRVTSARLAWQADGRALGLVVDGQPLGDRPGSTRWVAAIDLDTGAVGNIDLLGALDLGDRSSVSLCTGDDAGWSMDVPVGFPISLASQGAPLGALHGAFGRMRLAPTRVCVERVAGAPGSGVDAIPTHTAPSASSPASITLTLGEAKERRVFRCGVR
jgi:hypothetical protein